MAAPLALGSTLLLILLNPGHSSMAGERRFRCPSPLERLRVARPQTRAVSLSTDAERRRRLGGIGRLFLARQRGTAGAILTGSTESIRL